MRVWVRLYTSSWCHRKMLPLSLEAHGLWAIGLAYAGGQEREDFIPVTLVTRYVTVTGVTELVDAGLWEPIENGWLIHNFAGRQSKEEARRETNRLRQQRHRQNVTLPVTRVTRLDKSRVDKSRESPKGDTRVEGVVFELWRVATGHPQAKLTAQRLRAVRGRLREGYVEGDLTDAVRGVALDPWPERVNHNDLAVILRDGAHLEKFRDMWRNPRPVLALSENPLDRRIRESFRNLEVTA